MQIVPERADYAALAAVVARERARVAVAVVSLGAAGRVLVTICGSEKEALDLNYWQVARDSKMLRGDQEVDPQGDGHRLASESRHAVR